MLENIEEISILFDFYGELLPEKQREIFRLYHEDNLSLAEIATEYGITRQGIHEAVKRSTEKLRSYEVKLGLVQKFQSAESALSIINLKIRDVRKEYSENAELCHMLEEIGEVIDRLNP
jgi:predicted DNA-binding protein YlxM (UPF0122 family)